MSADVVSASALKRILGLPEASGLSNGRISLAAKMAANAQMLTLSAMQAELSGTEFRRRAGVHAGRQGVWPFPARWPADELNLDPILASAPPLIDANGDWSAAPFNFSPLTAFDFDLRISAARVKWRGHPLTDAAIELMNEDGRLTATLAEATAYGGLLKAEVALAPAAERL